ncbi:hypothetical protein SBV1_2630027 [Verrucomicrobia bacterium]|nr:hypothetical protein SBV1_2630027 [Verrucomicrobiota bacterium]
MEAVAHGATVRERDGQGQRKRGEGKPRKTTGHAQLTGFVVVRFGALDSALKSEMFPRISKHKTSTILIMWGRR